MIIGEGFPSPDQPDKGRIVTSRAGLGRDLWCERPWCYRRLQPEGVIWGSPVNGNHFGFLRDCYIQLTIQPLSSASSQPS